MPSDDHMGPPQGRAALFQGAGQRFGFTTFQLPSLRPGEILIEILATTLCASDLHTFSGRRSSMTPVVLGHESCGRVVGLPTEHVDRVDLNGRSIKLGDRLSWCLCTNCGQCPNCRNGVPQKCTDARKYGHCEWSNDGRSFGGLATHAVLPANLAVCCLPDGLSDEWACLANCAAATVIAMIREASVELNGRHVLVTGAGVLGQLAAFAALEQGASRISLVDRYQQRIQNASALGERIDGLTSLSPGVFEADVIFELTGHQRLTEIAIQNLRTGGTCVLGGAVYEQPSLGITAESIVRKMHRIVGVHNYAPCDLPPAIDLVTSFSSRVDSGQWFSHTFELEAVDRAFACASEAASFRTVVAPSPKEGC